MKHFFSLAALFASLLTTASRARDFQFFQPLDPPRPVQIIAHRGEAGQAPENSRPALLRCVEDGIEWAEIDLRQTKDGQFILSHDSGLDAGTNGLWKINEHTMAEWAQVDTGSSFSRQFAGTRLLSLHDCFQIARGKLNLYLDCKAVDPARLAGEILAAGMERQVVVYDRVENLRLVTQASQNRIATMAKWHPGMDIPTWSATNHLAAVEINADETSPAAAKAFHAAGIKVQTKNLDQWDNPEFWNKIINAGADWVQTDVPEEFAAHELWRRLPKRPVKISHHRGANRYAPENTLPAFAKSIRMGADFVEFDVRTSSDGRLFLMHDGSLDRTTTGQGRLKDNTSSALAGLSAGAKFGRPFAGVKIPTLEDFLVLTEGKIDLYFDAKALTPEALAEALERHHMSSRTVVYQSPAFLARLKKIDPRIRALPPLGDPAQLDALASGLRPYAVDAAWEILSKELIERCHRAGILVFSDALDGHERIEDYLQAMGWGIDLIQTNHPLRLMRAMEIWSMRH